MPRTNRARKATTANAEGGVPISVRFPASLRTRTERFAHEHHVALATAIRMIVGEHLEELDREAGLSRAELWQRAQAWSTLQTVVEGASDEATWDELRSVHSAPIKRSRAKRAAR